MIGSFMLDAFSFLWVGVRENIWYIHFKKQNDNLVRDGLHVMALRYLYGNFGSGILSVKNEMKLLVLVIGS